MMRRTASAIAAVLTLSAGAAAQQTQVFPDLASTGANLTPFSVGTVTFHHVFAASMFETLVGNDTFRIESIAFAPNSNVTLNASITVNFGYTSAIPGAEPTAGGLQTPIVGGGGAPNASGPMALFFDNPAFSATFSNANASNYQMIFPGTPFDYDPSQGNLLLEIIADIPSGTLSVPTVNAGGLASRAVNSTRISTTTHPHISHLVEFTYSIVSSGCYADCDGNDVLNIDDFLCFINEFATAQSLPPAQQITHYANCTGSTAQPILTIDDFLCFINEFAQGCP